MITVNIGEKEIPLKFGMREFEEIEENVGSMLDIQELIVKGKKRVRNTIQALRIMGNAGLKKNGEQPDLTDEWLEENMEPLMIKTYQMAVINTIQKSGRSEAETENNENEERDLVMEEIEEKKDPRNSHTGG